MRFLEDVKRRIAQICSGQQRVKDRLGCFRIGDGLYLGRGCRFHSLRMMLQKWMHFTGTKIIRSE